MPADNIDRRINEDSFDNPVVLIYHHLLSSTKHRVGTAYCVRIPLCVGSMPVVSAGYVVPVNRCVSMRLSVGYLRDRTNDIQRDSLIFYTGQINSTYCNPCVDIRATYFSARLIIRSAVMLSCQRGVWCMYKIGAERATITPDKTSMVEN